MNTNDVLRAIAPGKVNLCLFVGASRADGLHELVSLIQPVSLADDITLEVGPEGVTGDTVVCPGVEGENLALKAIHAYRDESGWNGPPIRLTITKRVPIAAGMGGGSSDAAAALRLIAQAAGRPDDPLLKKIAPTIGADVSAMLYSGRVLVTGAGEAVKTGFRGLAVASRINEKADSGGHKQMVRTGYDEDAASEAGMSRSPSDNGPRTEQSVGLLLLPSKQSLDTPAVYREFDRQAKPRTAEELQTLAAQLSDFISDDQLPPADLITNDLQQPATKLCPSIDRSLTLASEAGADHVLVSGSGPTVFGIFAAPRGVDRANAAAKKIQDKNPEIDTIVTRPLKYGADPSFSRTGSSTNALS